MGGHETRQASNQRDRRRRVAEIMASAARGEGDAVVALYMEFGGPIAAAMRRHLDDLGAHHVAADDLQGLVLDACIELCLRAGSWSPGGGALPWVWASRRLRMLASGFVGQWADELDEASASRCSRAAVGVDDEPRWESGDADLDGQGDDDEIETLRSLAARRGDARLLCEALATIASERNQRILLAYRLQASLGDPSPAITTGRRFGMQPAAVRQVVKRTSDKLAALIVNEPRFAPLADLALVA